MGGPVDILMYHSISDRGGPTSIAPDVFARQMAALAASGRPVVDIDLLASGEWPDGAVVITFDDAFDDFAKTAWPVLAHHGFACIVYVPTSRVGEAEDWTGAMTPPRPLMDWDTIRQLAGEGVAFGNHTASHPDMTGLDDAALEREVTAPKAELEDRLNRAVRHFAPPYGKTAPRVRAAIAKGHDTAVGTVLAQADARSDVFDLPRLEMFYFTSPGHWERHLAGRGRPYLTLRRGLRAVRSAVSHPAERA